MELNQLTAIAPIDGRYRNKVKQLAPYFSEFALIKYRVFVELAYFKALYEMPLPQLADVDKKAIAALQKIHEDFSENDAAEIKHIEKTTNHDVKAVEYFIKDKMDGLSLTAYREFIHFGLTSQDINNTAVPLSIRDFLNEQYYPTCQSLIDQLQSDALSWTNQPMLARTHGQPASPTKLGKEIMVFVQRIKSQLAQLKSIPISVKFGGATGNFNAHFCAYPSIDWHRFADKFVEQQLGLQRLQRK